MKSLKDEMRQIVQPKDLHKRAMTGIQRAAREQRRQKWLPTFLSVSLTAAVVYFIWLVSATSPEQQNSQATTLQHNLLGAYSAYWIAGLITALLLIFVILIAKRYKRWRKKLALIMVIMLSWIWNNAYYEEQQLPQPYVYPLSVNVTEEQNIKSIYVHAIINKGEFEKTIQIITINDIKLHVNGIGGLSLGSTAHHITTDATLDLQGNELNSLMKERTPIEAYAIFSDGQKIPFDIQFEQFERGKETESSGFEIDSNQNNKDLFKTELTTVLDIIPPPIISNYKLENDGEVIKSVGMGEEEEIDLLPYPMKRELLELSYWVNEERELRSYQNLYFIIETPDGTINKMVNILFPPFSRDVVKKVRQEMMQHE
ncbi:hypothetical protein MHH70_05135 [Metasolibacillus sp. FSL H7-0170]|uniref:hypothetical protein n=1 Tax=Metasolibacillus sp. FSL H7-0170 TaxID=2921431 RepID=UPI0031592479